jgi:hypothetical protein
MELGDALDLEHTAPLTTACCRASEYQPKFLPLLGLGLLPATVRRNELAYGFLHSLARPVCAATIGAGTD